MRKIKQTLLGDLEREVMEYLWDEGAGEPKSVHQFISTTRELTVNTIQSTLVRLNKKGLLSRHKVSHAYVYEPIVTREEFTRQAMGVIVDHLTSGEVDIMLSTFVSLTERTGTDNLEKLQQMITERRNIRRK